MFNKISHSQSKVSEMYFNFGISAENPINCWHQREELLTPGHEKTKINYYLNQSRPKMIKAEFTGSFKTNQIKKDETLLPPGERFSKTCFKVCTSKHPTGLTKPQNNNGFNFTQYQIFNSSSSSCI